MYEQLAMTVLRPAFIGTIVHLVIIIGFPLLTPLVSSGSLVWMHTASNTTKVG